MGMAVADPGMMEALSGSASRMIVNFYNHPVQNITKSEQEGRPIYEEQEFVEIRVPGDKDEIRQRAVRALDKQMYPREYAAFKANQEQPVTGTPLEHLPFLTKAQVMEFKALGLKTAEHVRDMPDSHAQRFMGINSLRTKINTFLEAAAGNAPLERLNSALAERDAEIELLRKNHAELLARFDAQAKARK